MQPRDYGEVHARFINELFKLEGGLAPLHTTDFGDRLEFTVTAMPSTTFRARFFYDFQESWMYLRLDCPSYQDKRLARIRCFKAFRRLLNEVVGYRDEYRWWWTPKSYL